MPIRTECPSCKTALGAPDSPTAQRVRCPFCGHAFTVEPKPVAVSRAASPPRSRTDEVTQPVRDFEIATARRGPMPRPKPDPVPVRKEPQVAARKSSRLPIGLLVGLGIGAFGLFILIVGGGLLIWLARSPSSSKASTETEVVQANEAAGAKPAAPFAAGPRAVPDAPAKNEGDEEFVDLPERGEAIPGVAGLNPEPQPGDAGGPGMPAGAPRVVLTNGLVQHVRGQPGLFFHVNYRFEQGAPVGTMSYIWVIVTARGRGFLQTLGPGSLRQQGSLEGQVRTIARTEAPYRTFLIAEIKVPGRPSQRVKISEELTLR